MKNLDLLNNEKASIEVLRKEIILQRAQITNKEFLDKENLLKEKESVFQFQCRKAGHLWLPFNYHKIKEINGFVLYNPIDQWTRKCSICGYTEVTHIIPPRLEKENNLAYELVLIKKDLDELLEKKESLEGLIKASASKENKLPLRKYLKKVKAKISRRTARIRKIDDELTNLRDEI